MTKILIIRYSSIGDIVLTTPVIRCLKMQLGAEIHFLTKKRFFQVIRTNPYIDKFHLHDKQNKSLIRELKAENFDYIIDLHHNLRSFKVKWKLRKPSFSFPKLNLEKWLLVKLKISKLPDQHIVDRYFKTVENLGVKNDMKGLDFFLDPEEKTDISCLPESHRVQGFLSFAIGGQHATKKLPVEKIIELCKSIGRPVVLLGGREDAETGLIIQNAIGDQIFNGCGMFSLNQSAFLINMSLGLITHDTGLMHIGAALGKNIFSIWGNTVPEFGMYPYMPGNEEKYRIFEVKGLPCRPCSKIGFPECPQKHFKCMLSQDISKISEEVNSLENSSLTQSQA